MADVLNLNSPDEIVGKTDYDLINNPIGFLGGNIQPALDHIKDIFGLIDLYQQEYSTPTEIIQDEIETIDLDYIREDLPKLVGCNARRCEADSGY
ncbi:MAG: hypothetical protein ACYTXY_03665 [Nostoc sp.]